MSGFAIPSSPSELEELLTDPTRMVELGKQPAALRDVIRQYTVNLLKDGELARQMREEMRAGFTDFAERAGIGKADVKEAFARLPMVASTARGGADLYGGLDLSRHERRQIAANGRGPAVPLMGKWPTLGEFLISIHPKTIERLGFPAALKDMSESMLGDGGALVPEEFRAELLRLSLETAIIRSRARVIPLSSASVRIPAIRDASHASTIFGGVSATWQGEGASLSTVTQPTFSGIVLTARKLTGYTVASNELLADSAISLEAIITTMFAEALAYFEDDAFIAGTGAGQPLGVLNAGALISVAKETGQAANTIVYENLVKMYSRVLPGSHNRCMWYMHPDTFPQLAQLALNVGTGGSAVWISNIQGGPPATIFGRPVVITEKAETLGTAGDIVLCDCGYYLIGDRQSLQMAASPHVNFTTDEMTWRFVQRVDGRPWLQTALIPRNGTNTLSPFVNLATRA